MKITFVLPFSGHLPVGGFKVAYEYANGLVRQGHKVTVVHSPYRKLGETSPSRLARQHLVYAGRALGLFGGYKPGEWFSLDPRVQTRWIPSLHFRWLPRADAVIATSWETAEWVAMYPEDRGCKHYLIQHQESTFPGTDPERVMATWKLPFKKIVIARWLEQIAASLQETASYIPNGLDFDRFGLDIPVADRDPQRLIMLYHHLDWKGSADGLEAFERVRREAPGVKATLFGIPPRPDNLPPWIEYLQKPSQSCLRRLYNEAAIFVGPSWAEGWPLPPAEAAQCGAALCITDIGGHREYAMPGETALLSPPREPEALADNLLTLIRDNEQRIALAMRAHGHIQQFTWGKAVSALEQCLLDRG